LNKLLTSVGFTALEANDGAAAIQAWEQANPQLILMDVRMPVMDGLEATRRIRATPGGQQVAIIALSASALDEDRATAMQRGVSDFLSKPCRESELLEKIGAHLGLSYVYADDHSSQPTPALAALSPALKCETIARLPVDLIEQLRFAVANGKKTRLNEIIRGVAEQDEPFAHVLQELSDSYNYDALTQLLQEAQP
jgi:two-component system sensor histidine kinase/response regulator